MKLHKLKLTDVYSFVAVQSINFTTHREKQFHELICELLIYNIFSE